MANLKNFYLGIMAEEAPKVFISYSWGNPKYVERVVNIAEKLMSNGIDVVIDKWSLKEGNNVHAFMEQCVSDPQIRKVLIMSDKTYKEKADSKTGGVGTESQIISKKVYDDVKQDKFIPVVLETENDNDPCLPVFLGSTFYIDLSDSTTFDENFEKLIRAILDKPIYKKPSLGKTPSFILEENSVKIISLPELDRLKTAIGKNTPFSGFVSDFLNGLFLQIKEFRITQDDAALFKDTEDELVVERINRMIAVRDAFVDFGVSIFKHNETKKPLEEIKEFFEKLITLKYPEEGVNYHSDWWFDHYTFLKYELLLHFSAILLRYKRYEDLSFFIYNTYFYRNFPRNPLKSTGISIFSDWPRILNEYRKKRLNLNRVNICVDMIKERSTGIINFDSIIEADYILGIATYLGIASGELKSVAHPWKPYCTIFEIPITIIEKMVSKSHFEEVKTIFRVKNPQEMRDLIQKGGSSEAIRYFGCQNGHFDRTPYISAFIEPEKIASI